MAKFGFILHPLQAADVERKFSVCKTLSDRIVEKIIKVLPPFKLSKINGIKSKLGTEAEGYFICCPLTSRQMIELPTAEVLDRIIKAASKAEKLGAQIVGLGAFTSVVGDKGVTVAKNIGIPVTTGNSYTVATALEGIKLASDIMGLDLKKSNILIVGATGSIGKACTKFLARNNKYLMLAARRKGKLNQFAMELRKEFNVSVKTTTNLNELLPKADVIIAVSSAVESLIDVNLLKSGAIVCDVARPRDVGQEVISSRNDVLVIDGGIVQVPGKVDFNFDFGFPPNTAYACMAETMILALEGRYENYSLGSDLEIEKVVTINNLAQKHGFRLASLRSMEREMTLQQVNRVRDIVNST